MKTQELHETKDWVTKKQSRTKAAKRPPRGFNHLTQAHPYPQPSKRAGGGFNPQPGTAAPGGPFQAWTKPLHPGQAWAQPLRGSGLAHPFHCKTSQALPMDNCLQLPTAPACHQFLKNSSWDIQDSQTARLTARA